MEILKRLLCFALIVGGGCDFLREPIRSDFRDAQPLVSAILHAGTDTVQVLLQRPASSPRGTEFVPLSGSQTFIDGPDGRVVLTEAAGGFPPCFLPREGGAISAEQSGTDGGLGCYSALLDAPIRPEVLYMIQATTPDGATLHGVTRVPAVPMMAQPDVRTRFQLDRVPSRLEPVELALWLQLGSGAAAVEMRLRPLKAYSGGAVQPGIQCGIDQFSAVQKREGSPTRAKVWIAGPIECVDTTSSVPGQMAIDSLAAELMITSYDSAYVEYLDLLLNDAVFAEKASPGLEGANGFFGSTASNRAEVVLLPATQ